MNEHIESLGEFDNHKLVSFVFDKKTKLEAYIAIHRGSLTTPSFGATRIARYEDKEDALKDALRLSRLMSYKAAMAGLDYGGGKGVILLPENISDADRAKVIASYSSSLHLIILLSQRRTRRRASQIYSGTTVLNLYVFLLTWLST